VWSVERALIATRFHAGFLLGLFFDPNMEVTYSSETSVDFRRTTLRYIPEDRTLRFEENIVLIIFEIHCDYENQVF
jgi:hypothetical protein